MQSILSGHGRTAVNRIPRPRRSDDGGGRHRMPATARSPRDRNIPAPGHRRIGTSGAMGWRSGPPKEGGRPAARPHLSEAHLVPDQRRDTGMIDQAHRAPGRFVKGIPLCVTPRAFTKRRKYSERTVTSRGHRRFFLATPSPHAVHRGKLGPWAPCDHTSSSTCGSTAGGLSPFAAVAGRARSARRPGWPTRRWTSMPRRQSPMTPRDAQSSAGRRASALGSPSPHQAGSAVPLCGTAASALVVPALSLRVGHPRVRRDRVPPAESVTPPWWNPPERDQSSEGGNRDHNSENRSNSPNNPGQFSSQLAAGAAISATPIRKSPTPVFGLFATLKYGTLTMRRRRAPSLLRQPQGRTFSGPYPPDR